MNTRIKRFISFESEQHIMVQLIPSPDNCRQYKSWEIWVWFEEGKWVCCSAFRGYNDIPIAGPEREVK